MLRGEHDREWRPGRLEWQKPPEPTLLPLETYLSQQQLHSTKPFRSITNIINFHPYTLHRQPPPEQISLMSERRRLYISPLNARLLPTVLPSSLLQQASNISYHIIETFPEKNYGYVDLPEIEADRLRKKLNGSVLKGSKMRAEVARHQKNATVGDKGLPMDSQIMPSKTSGKGKSKSKEEGIIAGYELPTERKVKRGWTEPSSSDVKPTKRRKDTVDKKKNSKTGSLTGEAECLFKTTLPPNVPSADVTKAGKAKKRKKGDSNREVIVHEFANTTKHASFLRDKPGTEGKKTASEYVEGKGWIDEDGNTIEAEPKKRQTRKNVKETSKETIDFKPRRSRRSSKLEVPVVEITRPGSKFVKGEPKEEETSSSGTSSDSESASEVESAEQSPPARKPTRASTRNPRTKSNGLGISAAGDDEVEVDRIDRLSITRSSATPPPAQEAPPTSAPTTNEIHPLEVLFKRPSNAASHTPKKPNLEVSTSFNLSDKAIEEGEGTSVLIPQTPFTQQDIRQRRQRSAAPTPDTAAPGKTFGDMWADTSDISDADEDDEQEDATAGKTEDLSTGSKDEKPESEFSKWFWEHRGETNRAWKRRRREAVKEKKQRDKKERKG